MTQAVARFESLGADAEFAIVQRSCGVRPPGVLAFARAVAIGDLVRLLDAKFADFCAPDQLALAAPGVLLDRRYGVRLPVEAPADTASDAALFDLLLREQARMQALAGRTLARLAAADTIFVYKAVAPADEAEVAALHAALCRFGDNALLLVRAGGEPGVRRAARHLYIGGISAFARGGAMLDGIRVAEWEALCRATWRQHAAPGASAAAARAPEVQPPAPPALPEPPDMVGQLAAAVRLHRDGKLAAAAAGYQALLRIDPGHADALHLLGLVADAEGQTERALELITQAIARKSSPRFFGNHGMILARLGRLDAAITAYRQALALQPDYPEALNNLGVALAARDQPGEAAAAHRRAVELRPEFAEAQLNLGHALGLLGDLQGAEAAFRRAFALKPALSPALGDAPRLLCVAADGTVPGAVYRCAHLAEAARAAGWEARWLPLADVREADLRGLSVLLFWRGELTGPVARLVAYTRAAGIRVGLDLDDLICEPELARVDVIDGIRSVGTTEARVREQFSRVRALLREADFAIGSTAELAGRMRRPGLPVWVLPNGFSADTLRVARAAVRARRRAPPPDLLRIGYAGGTRTHQRDIAPIAPALAAVLRARPRARLVLFRAPHGGAPMLQLDEFAEFSDLSENIEWRDLVKLRDLPAELARFDINLAPVEAGNPFAEAKSELKYFEAALAGVPTVASPTGPFRRAIQHDRTGLLADTPASWEAALLALLDDAPRRARLAEAAYHNALWRFGPERRALLARALLAELQGGGAAARAFAADGIRPPPPPVVLVAPPTEATIDSDDGQESRVTVAVICTADAPDAVGALGSLREQSLADLDVAVMDAGADAEAMARAASWLRAHAGRFHRITLRRVAPAGRARDAGFAWAETPFVLPLEAGQRLRPTAAEALLAAAEGAAAAFAYGAVVGGPPRYEPRRLQSGALPGAALLIAKWAWAAAGGFAAHDSAAAAGFGLLCRFAELAFVGAPVAEPLWHGGGDLAPVPVADGLLSRHPWLAAPA
jgi:tetratricopeptide (TPR) repeat protein